MSSVDIIQGNALEEMSLFEDGSFAAVVCDPPYWTLDKWRSIGTTTRLGGGRDGESDPDKFFPTIDLNYLIDTIREFDRLLPRNGHAWIMCDGETAPYILNYVRETDETSFSPCGKDSKGPKGYSKQYPVLKRTEDGKGYKQGMGYHGRASHEYVILLEKGRRKFSDENWPDVFEYPWIGAKESKAFTPDGKPYPTAKPVSLYRRLVELSSSEGETVLDPFAGSGACGEACLQLKRNAILIDVGDRSIATMTSRFCGGASGCLDMGLQI